MGMGFEDCRGHLITQVIYKAGIYSGVQAHVQKINDKAVFIPCMGHSFNLSGTAAAESCTEAVTFLEWCKRFMFFCRHRHIDGNYYVMS